MDSEIIALDDDGRPNFSFLQRSRTEGWRICWFVFDLLVAEVATQLGLPLKERRERLRKILKPDPPF